MIVTLRDAEIQTDDVMATESELTVEATGVEEEVQWVAKQLDLPDPDSDLMAQILTVTWSSIQFFSILIIVIVQWTLVKTM